MPEPLLKLYKKAQLFLDSESSVSDHYWAVGITKAIEKIWGHTLKKDQTIDALRMRGPLPGHWRTPNACCSKLGAK